MKTTLARVRAFLWITAVGLALAWPGAARAQEGELTLDEVIRMHANGISDDEVVERINSSGTVFTLDASALDRIQRAKLPPRIMVALMHTGTKKKDEGRFSVPTPENEPATSPDPVPTGPAPKVGETVPGAPDAALPGFTEFRQADGRFSIRIPDDWKICTTRNGRPTVKKEAFELAFVPPSEGDDLGLLKTFFAITYLPRKPDAAQPALEDWLKAYRQKLQVIEPNYTLGEEGIVDIGGGGKAARLVAEGVPRDQGVALKVVFYGVIDEQGFYLLRHGAPTEGYAALAETFTRMIGTLTFRPVAAEPAPKTETTETPVNDALAAKTRPFPYGRTPTTEETPKTEERPVEHHPESTTPHVVSTPPAATETEEESVASFVEYAEPDGRFKIQYPAGWKRADLATQDGIAYYFSSKPYNPREGKPFSNGVCVTVQPNVYSDAGAGDDMAKLATTGEGVRRQFVLSQESARSLVRVHEPGLLKLSGDRPALVYRYTLTYPNGGDELGFFVVAMQGENVFVSEANAPREKYMDVQATLLKVIESLILP